MLKIVLRLLLLVGVATALKTRGSLRRGRLNFIDKRILDGLFLNEEDLLAIARRNVHQAPVYRLKDFTVMFKHAASCSPSVIQFKQCKTSSSTFIPNGKGAARNYRRGSPCCDTNMVLVQPNTVSGVDRVTYDVVQEPDSVQVVHIGRCRSEGDVCSNKGFCTQEYRMQWVLVHTSPSEKKFVPVEMHNHCVCNYV